MIFCLQGDADLDQEDLSSWPVTCGPIPPRVLSSQFCESVILQFYNELLTHHQVSNSDINVKITLAETYN